MTAPTWPISTRRSWPPATPGSPPPCWRSPGSARTSAGRSRASDKAPSLGLSAQRERELEARVRVVQAVAEQLAQLRDAVAHGLRVDVQPLRHGLHLAGVVEPGAQR